MMTRSCQGSNVLLIVAALTQIVIHFAVSNIMQRKNIIFKGSTKKTKSPSESRGRRSFEKPLTRNEEK